MTTIEAKTKYFEAVGRRKTAVARARITPATKQSITVNDKDENWVAEEWLQIMTKSFNLKGNFDVVLKPKGTKIKPAL